MLYKLFAYNNIEYINKYSINNLKRDKLKDVDWIEIQITYQI